jgi:hypothetical protein
VRGGRLIEWILAIESLEVIRSQSRRSPLIPNPSPPRGEGSNALTPSTSATRFASPPASSGELFSTKSADSTRTSTSLSITTSGSEPRVLPHFVACRKNWCSTVPGTATCRRDSPIASPRRSQSCSEPNGGAGYPLTPSTKAGRQQPVRWPTWSATPNRGYQSAGTCGPWPCRTGGGIRLKD